MSLGNAPQGPTVFGPSALPANAKQANHLAHRHQHLLRGVGQLLSLR
ncbi:hypothetical protein [Corynebacterium faecium]|nr:hypothetical protein [Corynebacterium faecium]